MKKMRAKIWMVVAVCGAMTLCGCTGLEVGKILDALTNAPPDSTTVIVAPTTTTTTTTVPAVAQGDVWGGKAMIRLPDGTDTLTLTSDQDRANMNVRRTYAADCLRAAGADVLPTILCSELPGHQRAASPFRGGWGGEINGDFQAWMWYSDNDGRMFGAMLKGRGIVPVPILFASEAQGALSNPEWAERMIRDMTPFFTVHGCVGTVCVAWHAEKFMPPETVKRIAGYVRAAMPGVRVIVHATSGDYSGCGLDGIARDGI